MMVMLLSISLFAQHEHHMPSGDTSMKNMEGMDKPMLMTHSYSLNLPMNRNGSGTGWLPDSSPMYMYMIGNEKSSWMFHGNIFFRYNKQDLFDKGTRGDSKFDAPNMFMAMYNRKVGGNGLFNFSAMISLDPLTVGESGYPLLLQSGETYRGNQLVDRQHPHDLVSGLSMGYSYAVNKNVDVSAYFGYPGEPALGPTAFMHRVSSLNNPDAPLAHHWQDATHITFGVGTLGVRYRNLKLEGSVFTGREPGENRYNFDQTRFDSYSYRLSYNPANNWSLQFSQGFLNQPEAHEPNTDVQRTTASVTHSQNMRIFNWSQTLAWGLNKADGHDDSHSFLYESNWQFRTQALYWRYENVTKSTEELLLTSAFGERDFNFNALTIGYNHNIAPAAPAEILLGAQSTFNFMPAALQTLYGRTPIGFEVYLQVRPHRHGN